MKFLTQIAVFFTLTFMNTAAFASYELINIEDIDDTQPTAFQSHGVNIENTDIPICDYIASRVCNGSLLYDNPKKVLSAAISVTSLIFFGTICGVTSLQQDPILGATMGAIVGLVAGIVAHVGSSQIHLCLEKTCSRS